MRRDDVIRPQRIDLIKNVKNAGKYDGVLIRQELKAVMYSCLQLAKELANNKSLLNATKAKLELKGREKKRDELLGRASVYSISYFPRMG